MARLPLIGWRLMRRLDSAFAGSKRSLLRLADRSLLKAENQLRLMWRLLQKATPCLTIVALGRTSSDIRSTATCTNRVIFCREHESRSLPPMKLGGEGLTTFSSCPGIFGKRSWRRSINFRIGRGGSSFPCPNL